MNQRRVENAQPANSFPGGRSSTEVWRPKWPQLNLTALEDEEEDDNQNNSADADIHKISDDPGE